MQDATDWQVADKKQLLEKLLRTLEENARLRETVARLLKKQSATPVLRHVGRHDDFVTPGWVERHGIDIPRADGFFESPAGWVRVTHGVITNAGLKNQSILSVMIARELLDAEAERHANLYSDWRAAFFSRVEAARYSDVGAGDPEAWSKEDRFSKLLKAVDRIQLRFVDGMITTRPKEKTLEALNRGPESFIRAFEATRRAMDQINREADEALEATRSRRHAKEKPCA